MVQIDKYSLRYLILVMFFVVCCSSDSNSKKESNQNQISQKELRLKKALEMLELKILSSMAAKEYQVNDFDIYDIDEEKLFEHYIAIKNNHKVEADFTANHLVVYTISNPAFPDRGYNPQEAKEKANEALKKLQKGDSWLLVAQQYSHETLNHRKDGLVKNRKYGLFPTEVEEIIKTQNLNEPSAPIRTDFGYHIVEVIERNEKRVKSFEEIKDIIKNEIVEKRRKEVSSRFIEPIQKELNFEITEIGKADFPLLDVEAVGENEVLAYLNEKPIYESDFQWFLKDAFLPEQRIAVFSRPRARQSLLNSYLTMLILSEKARKDNLHATDEFKQKFLQMKKIIEEEFN